MHLSSAIVNRGSRGLWSLVLVVAGAVSLCGTGCIVEDDGDGGRSDNWGGYGGGGQLDATPHTALIDANQTVTTMPGQGVAMVVEYASGGHWTVYTTCDTQTSTNASGTPCTFEGFITAVPDSTGATSQISNVTGDGIEGNDYVESTDQGAHFYFETSSDKDQMTFDADAGATIQLTMYLDGEPQPRFVYWVGDSVLHTGAPTDPINLAPNGG